MPQAGKRVSWVELYLYNRHGVEELALDLEPRPYLWVLAGVTIVWAL